MIWNRKHWGVAFCAVPPGFLFPEVELMQVQANPIRRFSPGGRPELQLSSHPVGKALYFWAQAARTIMMGPLRYPIVHPDFRRDFAFHFAVGYPF